MFMYHHSNQMLDYLTSRRHNRILPETWLKNKQGYMPRKLGGSQDELKDLRLVYGKIYITPELCS